MVLSLFIALSIVLALTLLVRPSLGRAPYAFAVLFVLPVGAGLFGLEAHVERSKQTRFCTSCHVMEPYGRSLHVDDITLLPPVHYQNGDVPRDQACYTCHTTYTMYGGLYAKLRGVRHVLVNYLGEARAPAKLKLYQPYNNRECLHCHEATRRFEGGQTHSAEPGRMERIRRDQLSCLFAGCHDTVHDIAEVDSIPLWKPGGTP